MSLELTGTLVKFYETKSFPSGFSIQEFVVRTDERYPQEILVQAAKEKIDVLKNFKENDVVKVKFNLRGREYNGRHFVSLDMWAMDIAAAGNTTASNPSSFTEFIGKSEVTQNSPIEDNNFEQPKMKPQESDLVNEDDLPF
jgi:single-strand DNA-binding protein